ncbi:transposase [Catalinimonas alkaloidigena]|uniref:transposase n=1 Tax=Catalinimonas alkaloidigena TaxID=1075417 RepID=UPI002405864E|nr:transposase [Catalinimonas alkaloidigena]MDF9797149.1 transposase [Catalinimonas alkaloidigena]
MKQSNLGTLSKKLYFSYRLRRQIIEKINIGLLTEYQVCEKYGVSLKLIRQWRRSYYKHRILSPLNSFPMKAKKSPQEEIKALKARLAATEKAYQDEKVKARAYEIMTVAARSRSLKNSSRFQSEKSLVPIGSPSDSQ